MLFDIVRFNQFALDLLVREADSEEIERDINGEATEYHKSWRQESVGDYLDREGYCESFRDNYLIPMTASVWSTTPDKCSLEFPVLTLVRFLWNHHLLSSITARPDWLTIPGGTNQYIHAVLKDFPQDRIHMGDSVNSLRTLDDGQILVATKSGQEDTFDHVILAAHGDQVLDIIGADATEQEKDILSGFETSSNVAVLHSDLDVRSSPLLKILSSNDPLLTALLQLMPKHHSAWSSWNFITRSSSESTNVNHVCLTYWMNLLQHIPQETFGPVLVTLNPLTEPKPELTQGRWEYHHPRYTSAAIRSQSLLPEIQNTRGISYAGAWTKYGFHEDGFSSGLKVAIEHLGAELPFEFVDSTFSRGKKPALSWRDYAARSVIVAIQWLIRLLSGMFGIVRRSQDQMRKEQ
ncbi:MAG: hypothetical protein M1837_005913 [Sclerophora amabilis]|nr:MAG: hypothetical protein M1837_005913 [Sclerophora amabilis]